jgi:alkanesulfonate monooxygenase SsuD/methylene tetrahydromethanopterin reductase-like flavin-dependent oxidoreductase (luciferase family)
MGWPLPVQGGPPIMIGGGRKVLTLAGRVADIVSFNFDNRGCGGTRECAVRRRAGDGAAHSWVRGRRRPLTRSSWTVPTSPSLPDTASGVATAEKMGGMSGMSADDMAAHPNVPHRHRRRDLDRLVERANATASAL